MAIGACIETNCANDVNHGAEYPSDLNVSGEAQTQSSAPEVQLPPKYYTDRTTSLTRSAKLYGEADEEGSSDLMRARMQELIVKLENGDLRERVQAANELLEMSYDARAISTLIEVLGDESADVELRAGAAVSLEYYGATEDRVSAALSAALGTEVPSFVRQMVTQELPIYLNNGGTLDFFVRLQLFYDEDPIVREHIAQTFYLSPNLTPFESLVVTPVLMHMLTEDANPYARAFAAQAISKLPTARLATSVLIDALNDEHAYVRESAVYVLGVLGATEAISEITRLANDDTDPEVRFFVSQALSQINPAVEQAE